MKKRIENSERALPLLVEIARENFRDEVEVTTRVLTAWTDLAGASGWTADMVRRVEKEMRG